jgi:hypothetical protein
VIDGEVVVLREDGTSDFDALASCRHDKRALLCAFDVLAGAGQDLRGFPLVLRKGALASSSRIRSMAFSLRSTSGAISAPFYFISPATWASRGLSRSVSIGLWRWPVQALDQSEKPAHPAYSRMRDHISSSASRSAR